MKITTTITSSLLKQEMHKVYRKMQRLYWKTDFISRCVERRNDEIGLCILPYETLPDEKKLLDLAYEFYTSMEDSNTAYNVTLDLVIDEVERQIKDGSICLVKETKSEVEK